MPSRPHPQPQHPATPGRANTLGLNPRELGELLDNMDAAAPGKPPSNRDYIRWPFRRASLVLTVEHADGHSATLSVACRNLSRTGVAVLHSAYMHPGARCTITLPHPGRGGVPVKARVARCIHRAGVVHEVGLVFESPVDVREFVRRGPFAECFSLEQVKPEDLRGTLLLVEPDPMAARIVQHFLRGTSLHIRIAPSLAAALESLDATESLVLTDLHLPDGSAPGLMAELRARRCRVPVIVATSDTSAAAHRVLEAAKPGAILARPFSQQTLLRAVAEFLVVQGGGPPQSIPDGISPALIDAFVQAASGYADRLQALVTRNDAAAVRTLCLQISGTAPMLGFTALGEIAAEAAGILARDGALAQAKQAVHDLIASCRRTRGRSAA